MENKCFFKGKRQRNFTFAFLWWKTYSTV